MNYPRVVRLPRVFANPGEDYALDRMPWFRRVFKDVPLGRTVYRWFLSVDPDVLDSACRKLYKWGANGWVFSGDARMFAQFADERDWAAYYDLDEDERHALTGHWIDSPEEYEWEHRGMAQRGWIYYERRRHRMG